MSMTRALFLAALATAVAMPRASMADEGRIRATLQGFSEVPAISTTGMGRFEARLSQDGAAIDYELTYTGLESTAIASHIHIGQKGVAGGVMAFLCGGGGKPACPPEGTVTGTITAADVIGPTAQGIEPGEFAEMLRAIDAGVTYVNVHTTNHPGGEIRGQVKGETD